MKLKTKYIFIVILLILIFISSLFIGKYPLNITDIINKEPIAIKILINLRIPRTLIALTAGFSLGVVGLIFQTLFHNPLASPDIIGVSSSASVGAAFAILFLGNHAFSTTLCAFIGSLISVIIILIISSKFRSSSVIILSGVAIHSLSQTLLMMLKLMADPEKELASIEYWIMGGLNTITLKQIPGVILICTVCMITVFLLYRQIVLLSLNEDEASLLGVNIKVMRIILILTTTLCIASIISVTGIISFIGLLAPHCAKLIHKRYSIHTMYISGLLGSVILLIADILARSISASELPVSILTSIIGAPFLIYLIIRKENNYE